LRGEVICSILLVANLTAPFIAPIEVVSDDFGWNSGIQFSWTKMGVVIDVGNPGEPDDVGASSGHVIFDENMYKFWYSAFDGITTRIMYATSPDGLAFTKYGVVMEPGAPGDYDDDWARDPMVLRYDQGTYKMWYTGQKKSVWGWRIMYATSSDGINWQKHGVVFTKTHLGLAVAHPNVLIDDSGTYRMWFSEYDMAHWRIRYATSSDGLTWTDQGLTLDIGAPGDPDDFYIYMPSVLIEPDGTHVMFYSTSDGNPYNHVEIYYATSPTGLSGSWTKQGLSLKRGEEGDYDEIQAIRPTLTRRPDGLHELWYIAYDGSKRRYALALEKGQIPPVAYIGEDGTIKEGESVYLDMSSSYDEDGQIVRYEVDFGDGSSYIWEPTHDQDIPPVVEHEYGDDGHGIDGIYTVTLTVTDEDGLTASDSMIATVENTVPIIAASLPPSVREGAELTEYIFVADPGSDDLVFTFDWGDGSPSIVLTDLNDPSVGPDPYPSPQVNPRQVEKSESHTYGDNGIYTATFSVADDDKGEASVPIEMNVENVPPSLSVTVPEPINEGDGIVLVVNSEDPGSDDIFLDLDWGDGTTEKRAYYNDGVGPDPPQSPGGNYPFGVTETFSHAYGDNGVYTVALAVSDDDRGQTTKNIVVVVLNVAPTIAPFGPFALDEGSQLIVSSLATDPGSDDLVFQWLWEHGPSFQNTYYNNGLGPDPYPSPGGTFPFSATGTTLHTYGDNGNFTIVLNVTDDDGDSTIYSSNVFVRNVAPTVLSMNHTVFTNKPRTIGYWGHQCEVESPYGDHTGILQEWISEISSQSQVFSQVSNKDDICDIVAEGNAEDIVVMARRQVMGVWLNVVSGKLHPLTAIDMPSLTSSETLEEAIEEIEYIILTSTIRDEMERVKDIADNTNNGIGIARAFVEFTATATDPGSDDLTFHWDFGDGSPLFSTTYYNNAPLDTPDPYPSPEVSPVQTTDAVHHCYATSGSYTVTLTVEDDDRGMTAETVVVEIP
jgi:PKD repeat protein/predicted GH43/DUF377 family glycosyl hydrolase